ncbi:MAG: THUMP domain-containing protein [Desulfurococcales archaeon]|nr:THUMP domain-containing protein [Desulfurococcales archaeon]
MKLLLTTNPGLEDIAGIECREELDCRVVELRKGRGRLIVELESNGVDDYIYTKISSMRSIHSAVLLLATHKVGYSSRALETIYEVTVNSGIEDYLSYPYTFAVESKRIGEGHEYHSMDISRVVGQAVVDVSRSKGIPVAVRLNSPSVIVYAEVDDEIFRVGVLLSGERSMHRRGYRVYDHPAALKPSIAYSMFRIAGITDGEVVLDPMCGGGTVAIEAAMLYENSSIICIDKNIEYIKGAIMNALAARVYNRIQFIVGDSTKLDKLLSHDSVDAVVSNPPYGIRMGSPGMVKRVYRGLLYSLYNVLSSGGRAVFITTESKYMARTSEAVGFKVDHIRRVRHGDLWASIILIRKA